MKRENIKDNIILHSIMCLMGGFCGGYALLSRASMFASAQTLNMIEVVIALLGRNFHEMFLRLICMVLYVSGIFLGLCAIKSKRFSEYRYAILVDILGAVVVFMIPDVDDVIIYVMPIFFMAATQWTIFHGNSKYNSSTIFSTNNLKQLTLSLGEYLFDKDPEHLDKAKFFGNSLLWFHIGVAVSYFSCRLFDVNAILIAVPIGVIAYLMT